MLWARISVGWASQEVPSSVLDIDVQSPVGEMCELILPGAPSIWGSPKASALNTHGRTVPCRRVDVCQLLPILHPTSP